MGALIRNERTSGSPKGVSGARRPKARRRPNIYIPIPASGCTVPCHRSFIKLFYFLFLEGMDKGILKEEAGVSNGLVGCPRQYGLLINSQETCCSRAAVSNPAEPLENGLEGGLVARRPCQQMFVVTAPSFHGRAWIRGNNYAENFPVFFCLQGQFCKGDTQ